MLDQDFPIEVIVDLKLPQAAQDPVPRQCRLRRIYEPHTLGLCFLPAKGDGFSVGGLAAEITHRHQRNRMVVLLVDLELDAAGDSSADQRKEYFEGTIAFLKRVNYVPI